LRWREGEEIVERKYSNKPRSNLYRGPSQNGADRRQREMLPMVSEGKKTRNGMLGVGLLRVFGGKETWLSVPGAMGRGFKTVLGMKKHAIHPAATPAGGQRRQKAQKDNRDRNTWRKKTGELPVYYLTKRPCAKVIAGGGEAKRRVI